MTLSNIIAGDYAGVSAFCHVLRLHNHYNITLRCGGMRHLLPYKKMGVIIRLASFHMFMIPVYTDPRVAQVWDSSTEDKLGSEAEGDPGAARDLRVRRRAASSGGQYPMHYVWHANTKIIIVSL